MAPRENENKAYAKFGGDKQRTLWYAMVFSGVVNCYLSYHVIAPNKEGGGWGGGWGLGRSFICFGSSGSEGLTRSHNRGRRL